MLKTIKQTAFAFFAVLAFDADSTFASAPPNITKEELALLPKYCPYTQSFPLGIKLGGDNHPAAQQWSATIGPTFMHLHHYCWALVELNRAHRSNTPAVIRNGLRNSALGNLWYVVERGEIDFVLLPEIYTLIGKTELLLNQPVKASAAFEKSRRQKPDYWPAYYYWAEYLYSKGKNKEALSITNEGIKHSPESRALIELQNKIANNKIEQ